MSSGFTPFASASQARNPRRTYDLFGFTSDGLQVTNNNGTNALSGYSTLGTTTAALSGIELEIFNLSSSASRFQLRVKTGGTVVIQDFQFKQNTTSRQVIFIPLQIASGVLVEVAIRTSSNGNSARFAARGVVANSLDAPGFTTMTSLLTVNTASTLPSSTTVDDSGTWVALVASTAADYGALFPIVGGNTTAPTTGQRSTVFLSTGTASNEDASIFWEGQFQVSTANPYVSEGLWGPVEAFIPSGTRLSMKIVGPTSIPDTFYAGLWALS